jgi:hypothetical protein
LPWPATPFDNVRLFGISPKLDQILLTPALLLLSGGAADRETGRLARLAALVACSRRPSCGRLKAIAPRRHAAADARLSQRSRGANWARKPGLDVS